MKKPKPKKKSRTVWDAKKQEFNKLSKPVGGQATEDQVVKKGPAVEMSPGFSRVRRKIKKGRK